MADQRKMGKRREVAKAESAKGAARIKVERQAATTSKNLPRMSQHGRRLGFK
jgi:hypothetical protein